MNALRGKISSDLADLDRLSAEHGGWIPASHQVRPTAEQIQRKLAMKAQIERGWSSMRDYLLHTIFERPGDTNYVGQRYVAGADSPAESPLDSRFLPNAYPYQLADPDGRHWVLWYYDEKRPALLTDDVIDAQIVAHLRTVVGSDAFQFAWYENPKMSFPDLYHVQCFWRPFSMIRQ